MAIPIWVRAAVGSRRRGLIVAGAIVALGAGTAGVAATSDAWASDPSGPSAETVVVVAEAPLGPSTTASAGSAAGLAGAAPPTATAGGAPSTGVAGNASLTSAAPSDATSSSDADANAAAVTGTLTSLSYTFPAGSGGSLQQPLGISAAQGHVYVSNTSDNVVSRLDGSTTTTVAGSLEAFGETGDGGPATSASLSQPTGTAEDAGGNIYIADTGDNVIRKVDAATGIITRFAGTGRPGAAGVGGQATDARLDAPQAVAVDAAGNVFIADTHNNRVTEVLPNGHMVRFAGKGAAGYAGDGGQAIQADLTEPTGVAVDAAGNVYVADAGNNVIRRVDASTGIISTIAGDFAADQANDGLGGFSGDGGPATSAQLSEPQGVALDGAGDLFIADTLNHAIREVTPDGTISTVVNHAGSGGAAPTSGGETNGPATASRLNGPSAVAVDDSTATLYIADTHNSRAAAVTGLAGTGSVPGPIAPAIPVR